MDIYDGDLAEEFEKTSATHIVSNNGVRRRKIICPLLLFVVKYKASKSRFVFTNFCRPLLDRTRNEKTNCKRKNENKRETKKEKLKKKNIQQGRGNKPKMKACLNLQVIRKVAN